MEVAQRSLHAVVVSSSSNASTTPLPTLVAQPTPPQPTDAPRKVDAAAEPAVSDERPEAAVVPAPPASGRPPSERARTSASTPTSSRRRLLPWALLIVAAMVVAGIVTAIAASGSPSGSTAAPPATGKSTQTSRPGASTAAVGSKSATASASSTAASPASPTISPADTATQLTSAISHYYQLVPAHLDQAWGYLTAGYQQNPAGGTTGYHDFWNQIQRVSVSDIVAQPPSSVTAVIDYYYRNGQTVEERTSFGLVRSGGIWKIASSSVLSSKTL